jgi:two-component system, OmpR family, response regulator
MDTARRPRILVVDEEEPITHVLRLGLELEGWEVDVAHSGEDALRRAAGADVILLDMMLPDRRGTEVAAALRLAGSDAYVLFVTGRTDLDERMAAYRAGADDYLTKPFSVEDVVGRVAAEVRRRGFAADADERMAREGHPTLQGAA